MQQTKPDRASWTVREFCARLGISASCFWKYHQLGKIKSFKIGGRVLIPDAELRRILAEGVRS